MQPHFILDFDGVISDSRLIATEEINRLRHEAYPMLPEVDGQDGLARLFWGPLKTSLHRFGLSNKDTECFFDAHSYAMHQRAFELFPFDNIVKVLQEQACGKCSIVTSAYSDAVYLILRKSPYYTDELFVEVIGREVRQPKTDKINLLIAKHQLNRSKILHFGDMVSDLFYSREAHIPFCGVGWGYHPIDYIQGFNPDFSVTSPEEFQRLLRWWVEACEQNTTVN